MAGAHSKRGMFSRRAATLGAMLLLVPAALGSAVNSGVEDGDPDDKYGVDTTTAETEDLEPMATIGGMAEVERGAHAIIEGEPDEPHRPLKNNGTWGDMGGEPICKNGMWSEIEYNKLIHGHAHPHIQCWRDPPCIRWSWLTFDNCRKLADDSQWPTYDPHIPELPENLFSFDLLAEEFFENKTVAFIGDSTNRIVWHAAECEAAKSPDALWRPAIEDEMYKDENGYELTKRLAALKDYNDAERSRGQSWWEQPLIWEEHGTVLIHKGLGRYKGNEQDLKDLLALVDVVVVNMGNEYGGDDLEGYEDMMHLAAQLDLFARQPNKVALFRESGAQHYSGDGSIHTWSDAHPEAAQQCHCKPLNDVHEITQVTDLNAILRKLHRHHPRIGLLHYYELTAPRYDMHEESFCAFGHGATPVRCCDCVHFCYTPQMWKVFFSEMYEQVRIHMTSNVNGVTRSVRRRSHISPRRAARVEEERRRKKR